MDRSGIPNEVYEAAEAIGADAIVYFDSSTRTVYIKPDPDSAAIGRKLANKKQVRKQGAG